MVLAAGLKGVQAKNVDGLFFFLDVRFADLSTCLILQNEEVCVTREVPRRVSAETERQTPRRVRLSASDRTPERTHRVGE